MITIKRDGKPLDLGNLQLTFRLRSPLWNDVPSHTFSFDIDNNDNNRLILGLLHRPTNTQATGQTCAVECDVHGWKLGATLKVQSATEKVLRCFLAIDNGQLNMDWGDQMLNELAFPTVNKENGIYNLMMENKSLTSDESPCQFPTTRIPLFFGEEFAPDALFYAKWINFYDPETASYPISHVLPTGEPFSPTAYVPFFYLQYIIKTICNLNSITFSDNSLINSALKELLIFNNRCIDVKNPAQYYRASLTSTTVTFTALGTIKMDDDYTFPNCDDNLVYRTDTGTIYLLNAGVQEILLFLKGLNWEYVNSYAVVYINNTAYPIYTKGDTYIRHTEFFDETQQYGHITIKIAAYLMLHNEFVQVWYHGGSYITGRNASYSNLPNIEQVTAIYPANHMPLIKVKDLFAWISDAFACHPIYNGADRTLQFVFLKDVLTKPPSRDMGDMDSETEYSPDSITNLSFAFEINNDDAPIIADITGFIFLGEYNYFYELPMPPTNNHSAYVITDGKFYIYTWNPTLSKYEWNIYSDYMLNAGSKVPEMEITPKWHPPANYVDGGDIFGSTPYVDCKGSSPYFKIGLNKSPLLLMFYHGMQRAAHDEGTPWYFPLASGLMHDTFGIQIGTLEMRWDGPSGLRETYWRAVEEFYAQRWGLEGRRQIDAAFLKQLAWDEGYLHKGREYLLDSVEFTATQMGFTAAKITAWRKQ